MILDILRGTPIWVFALFAFLMYMGAQRLRTRRIDMRRLWIAPAVFIVWGLSGLGGRPDPFAVTLACWLIGGVIGVLIGRVLEPLPQIDWAQRQVLQPASVIPLLRNVTLFATHYLLHVGAFFAPASAHLMRWDAAVSGLGAGYFAGWAIGLLSGRPAARSETAADAARL